MTYTKWRYGLETPEWIGENRTRKNEKFWHGKNTCVKYIEFSVHFHWSITGVSKGLENKKQGSSQNALPVYKTWNRQESTVLHLTTLKNISHK